MQAKLGTARLATIASAWVILAVMAPSFEWPLVVVAVVMVAVVMIGSAHLEKRRRPELWVFFTAVVSFQALVAVGGVLTGGPRTPLVCRPDCGSTAISGNGRLDALADPRLASKRLADPPRDLRAACR
ncbi:MAG: hypothetical protein ACLP01_24040 [Solirubrobacteraceae bacterium]